MDQQQYPAKWKARHDGLEVLGSRRPNVLDENAKPKKPLAHCSTPS
jgi:hypothetical protein